jgi:hypothetical protein
VISLLVTHSASMIVWSVSIEGVSAYTLPCVWMHRCRDGTGVVSPSRCNVTGPSTPITGSGPSSEAGKSVLLTQDCCRNWN